MVGDSNIKIGNDIPSNTETVSKRGTQLKRIIEQYNLNIINANENKCKEKWTREQEEKESVIDYVITSQAYMETIKSMEIDEQKQYGLDKVECQNRQTKITYSDPNAILININFLSSIEVSRKRNLIQEKDIRSTEQ